jgi:hypothetical protein
MVTKKQRGDNAYHDLYTKGGMCLGCENIDYRMQAELVDVPQDVLDQFIDQKTKEKQDEWEQKKEAVQERGDDSREGWQGPRFHQSDFCEQGTTE